MYKVRHTLYMRIPHAHILVNRYRRNNNKHYGQTLISCVSLTVCASFFLSRHGNCRNVFEKKCLIRCCVAMLLRESSFKRNEIQFGHSMNFNSVFLVRYVSVIEIHSCRLLEIRVAYNAFQACVICVSTLNTFAALFLYFSYFFICHGNCRSSACAMRTK